MGARTTMIVGEMIVNKYFEGVSLRDLKVGITEFVVASLMQLMANGSHADAFRVMVEWHHAATVALVILERYERDGMI